MGKHDTLLALAGDLPIPHHGVGWLTGHWDRSPVYDREAGISEEIVLCQQSSAMVYGTSRTLLYVEDGINYEIQFDIGESLSTTCKRH